MGRGLRAPGPAPGALSSLRQLGLRPLEVTAGACPPLWLPVVEAAAEACGGWGALGGG